MTHHVHLREIENTDARQIASLIDNKKIWDNVRDYLPHPYSIEDGQEFCKIVAEQNPTQNWAITYDETLVGICGARPLDDVYRQTAEIGYWIGEPWWGKGIATEAIAQLVRIGFEHLSMTRLEAEVYAFNVASMRVLEKNGFELEGILKSRIVKNGVTWDAHMYARINESMKKEKRG